MPSTSRSSSEFTLGPGDVLRISVPMIPQLNERIVRVSEDDTIALPLLGVLHVSGMTEDDLRQDLAGRLRRYMYNPQVEVYLKTAENRVVSVVGSVKTPGRYLLASRSDTVMTMLSRAGGTTDLAGSQIFLFPAPSTTRSAASSFPFRVAAVADASIPRSDPVEHPEPATLSDNQRPSSIDSAIPTTEQPGTALVINTSTSGRYLEMPVRPGDVLFVPAAGTVAVQGWVDKAGSFPVTPGMTVLGAVAAAGGPMFSSSATLVRANQGSGPQQISLNLSKIKGGQESDLPVRGGDVVIVERSAAGAIPYSLYTVISRVGIGLPMF